MDEATPERWLPVVGYEAYYAISDWGRARSLRKGMILKPSYSNQGGYGLVILTANGNAVGRYIHRLVLEAFVGPCPPGMETRHLDGDPRNCALTNLAWGTSSENKQDQIRHGTHARCWDRCKNGHEFTPENTRLVYHPDGSLKQRVCRACANDKTKERYRARLTSGLTCTEEGCDDPLWVKGLCVKHYAQQW